MKATVKTSSVKSAFLMLCYAVAGAAFKCSRYLELRPKALYRIPTSSKSWILFAGDLTKN